jgi:hypothetical protein
VLFTRRSPAPRGAGQLIATIAAAAALLLSLALPVAADSGPTRLYGASASPGSGTTATTIELTVGYRNHEGSGPASVTVLIDGTPHDMAAGGSDWKHGVVYSFATTLPIGTHSFSFEASDTRKFTDAAPGGTVTISAPPTPAPKPTPAPTPTPTPAPPATPKPTLTPTPKATPAPTTAPDPTNTPAPDPGGVGSGPTPTPPSGPTPTTSIGGGGSNPSDGPSAGGGNVGPVDPTTGPWAGGAADPGTQPDPSSEPSSGAAIITAGGPGPESGGPTGPVSGSQGGVLDPPAAGVGAGAFMATLTVLGFDNGPHLGLLPTLVGTSGAVAMGMAFSIFGKKRRDEEQPVLDEVLQAQAARGSDVRASGDLMSRPFIAPLEGEAAMPRWRRPSLLEARKSDPARTVGTTQRLAFADGGAADEGRERRVVRYRVVRLLDAPDELRSAELGQLDQGDEVQLLERSGAYWLVLCPDGRRGWLHKMTLGEIVDDTQPGTAGVGWGIPEPAGDILQSMLDARGRAS